MSGQTLPPTQENIPLIRKHLNEVFLSQKTFDLKWRLENLHKLQSLIQDNRERLIQAVQHDLGKKEPFEIMNSEINLPLSEIKEIISHLEKWVRPEPVSSNIAVLPASSFVYKIPRGTVLIISPWNYPINLALVPLMGAIAAGCTVFLKVSRHSEKTGALLEELINKYLDTSAIVVESAGGAPMITALVKEKWDYVFFTGSVDVGRVVYEAAAKHLTPVTLELGGKNPCIIHNDAHLEITARRIVWGKFFNNGQTCITADYLLVHKDIVEQLIEKLKFYINKFFGPDPKQSTSYCRIINERAFDRLITYLQDGRVVAGGTFDRKDKYIAPTVLVNVNPDSPVMTNEIFGPILPIIPYTSLDDAIKFINSRPLPLALYCFSQSNKVAEEVLNRTRSGGAGVNDLLLHFTNSNLPFGGIGESGMGQYHGKLTFETFTHKRAVVKALSSPLLDLPIRYPPYNEFKTNLTDGLTSGRWINRAAFIGKVVLGFSVTAILLKSKL